MKLTNKQMLHALETRLRYLRLQLEQHEKKVKQSKYLISVGESLESRIGKISNAEAIISSGISINTEFDLLMKHKYIRNMNMNIYKYFDDLRNEQKSEDIVLTRVQQDEIHAAFNEMQNKGTELYEILWIIVNFYVTGGVLDKAEKPLRDWENINNES